MNRILRSNSVDCESFLESNSPDILALCETNLDDSTDSGNFSVRGYLHLIRKDSTTHMHSLAVYMKKGHHFVRDLSLENSVDSYFCFWLALLHSASYFFFLCQSSSSSSYTAFDYISSNIAEVLSINPSANVFDIREFVMSIIRTGSPILVELTDLVNSLIIFFVGINLIQMIHFPTRMLDSDFHSPALLDLFTMTFPPLGNSDHVVVLLSIKFTTGCPISSHNL